MKMSAKKRVPPYEEGIMKKVELKNLRVYQYVLPFNYENVEVARKYTGGETHGMELNTVNSYSPQPERLAADYIELTEKKPIVQVEVIGSACTPPGWVQLNAEPMHGFRRNDEIVSIMPVRFRVGNLWGMHLRVDQWATGNEGVDRYRGRSPAYERIPREFTRRNPKFTGYGMKTDYREFPLAGMSSALFSIPPSLKIQITAGSECISWNDDTYPDDVHYSIRIIRVTVCTIAR
jgi:hypothetical protein